MPSQLGQSSPIDDDGLDIDDDVDDDRLETELDDDDDDDELETELGDDDDDGLEMDEL